jgi:beta-phosphoglucomutase
MKYKAIIFDMDGTIVDTERIWSTANQLLIERRGIEYTSELKAALTDQLRGGSMHRSCAIIKELARLSEPLEQLVREKAQIAAELYKNGVQFIDGFPEFHAHIAKRDLKRAIATNAHDETIRATDAVLNLRQFFGQHIYGISAVNYQGKPNPAIYLYAARQLGANPEHCIAIEDSAYGIEAAQGAGIFCIGINTGRDYDQIKKADAIVDHYHEIDIKKLMA